MQYLTLILLLFLPILVWSDSSSNSEKNTKNYPPKKYKVIAYEGPYGSTKEELQACEVIADNINHMEQHNVNWNCDFPISANVYELSKPTWIKVDEEEKIRALKIIDRKPSKSDVYSYSYNVDNFEGNEKIYRLSRNKEYNFCESHAYSQKSAIWFATQEGEPLTSRPEINPSMKYRASGFVIFNKKLYTIGYINQSENFWVHGMNEKINSPGRRGVFTGACTIEKIK